MSRWLRRTFVIALLVAAGVAAWWFGIRPDPVPVTVKQAEIGRVEETVTNSRAGTINTRRRASLSPEVGGRVEEIPVKEGDRVLRGQALLRIADADARAQLDVTERAARAAAAAERQACLTAQQSARDLERARQLAKDEVVSAERLEQARSTQEVTASACDAARATTRQAQAALELSRANLAKTTVLAPFDGVIAEVRAEAGEFIAPQMPGVFMQPVIDLIDDRDVYVSAPLDEVDVGKVTVGLPVRITLDPYPDTPLDGTVTRVAPYVEDAREQSRTFEVEVAFQEPLREGIVLKPGATADIEVILRAKDSVLRIPSYALLEGDRVLVVRGDRLVSETVSPGLRNWEYVEITSGLAAGDRVVVSLDRAEVKAGARVKVADSAP